MSIDDAFYAGAYWGPRVDSVDDCAVRLRRFLTELGSIHPAMATWFRKTYQRQPGNMQPVSVDIDSLGKILGATGYADSSNFPSGVGQTIGLWNGRDPDSIGVTITCGVTRQGLSNAVAVQLPQANNENLALFSETTACLVIRALANCWDPDWATWTSHELAEKEGADSGAVILGAATYLREQRIQLRELPHDILAENIANGSLLLFRHRLPTEIAYEDIRILRNALEKNHVI